jgi:hypothetical protein
LNACEKAGTLRNKTIIRKIVVFIGRNWLLSVLFNFNNDRTFERW